MLGFTTGDLLEVWSKFVNVKKLTLKDYTLNNVPGQWYMFVLLRPIGSAKLKLMPFSGTPLNN